MILRMQPVHLSYFQNNICAIPDDPEPARARAKLGFDPFFLGALNKQCTEKTGPSCQKGSVSEWQKPQNFFRHPAAVQRPRNYAILLVVLRNHAILLVVLGTQNHEFGPRFSYTVLKLLEWPRGNTHHPKMLAPNHSNSFQQ